MTNAMQCDVVIVGAGPAGMAAALIFAESGLKVVVVDEQPRLGGQILRQPPRSFRVAHWLAGRIYAANKGLLENAERETRVTWLTSATAWGLFQSQIVVGSAAVAGFDLMYVCGSTSGRVRARCVLIASGCYELPTPLPGWTLSGVMGTGGIQTLLKSQQLIVGGRIVLSGSHPLQLIVADQLVRAGAKVEAVLFAQSWTRIFRLLRHPSVLVRAGSQLAQVMRALVRLRLHRVRVRFGVAVTAAEGADQLCAVRLSRTDGRGVASERIECDALGLCYGFLASSELARQAGARSHWLESGGWVIDNDAAGRSSVPGLYVAGEVAGIAGAEAARLGGEIVARSMLADSWADAKHDPTPLAGCQRRLSQLRRFSAVLAEAASMEPAFLTGLVMPDTIICRCEEVSCQTIEDALAANPLLRSLSSLKLLTRVGMGLCQGRYCEVSLRRLLCQRGVDPARLGCYTIRPPVKPVPVGALCAEPGADTIDPVQLERDVPLTQIASSRWL